MTTTATTNSKELYAEVITPNGGKFSIGYDLGEDFDTAVVIEHNPDGTMTIIEERKRGNNKGESI